MAEKPQSIAPRKLPCDIAVLFRDAETAGGLVDRLSDAASLSANGFSIRVGKLGERVIALGVAGKNTDLAEVTDAIYYAHKPKLVLIGTQAIGIADGIAANTVVFASGLVADSGELLELQPWTDSAQRRGQLWTTKAISNPPTGVLAAIPPGNFSAAKWCRDHDVAIEIAAVATHHASERPPADVQQVRNQPTLAGRMGAFLGAAWRRPSSVPDLWRQKESVWVAREKLGDAIQKMIVPAN